METRRRFMRKGFMLSKVLTVALFLTSCSLERNWPYDQSSGLGLTEHLIWVPYDGSVLSVGRFPLYYSTTAPFDRSKPTVLFCDGGPGQVLEPAKPGFIDSLSQDFNVVYFHFRGSGLSQFPASNGYDRYLRSKFAVEDI